jgi:hypothetical protein
MKISRIAFGTTVVVLSLLTFAFVASSRAGYETARYEVLEKDGDFELRRYEAHVVAATPMNDGAQNGSFGRLFQYISGKNEGEKKIEMTTPVFMPAGEGGEPGEMQFVVPAGVVKEGAPAPADPSVKLKTMESGRYAVIRYSGVARAEDRKTRVEELRAKITALGLEAVGDPIHAGYDPPWTPGPMRRNEVLIRVK